MSRGVRAIPRRTLLAALSTLPWLGCGGDTGSSLVTFTAVAVGRGTRGAVFRTAAGFDVTLQTARLRVGAVYLSTLPAAQNSQDAACLADGIRVGELTRMLEVDALSSADQPFPTPGTGLALRAQSAEIWLKWDDQDVNAVSTPGPIATLEGSARRGGVTRAFTAEVSIGENRKRAPQSPVFPGGNPICSERVVTPLSFDALPTDGAILEVAIDPRVWVDQLDFDALTESDRQGATYVIPDDSGSSLGFNLLTGLRQTRGATTLRFR